jgi:hypothetical protein
MLVVMVLGLVGTARGQETLHEEPGFVDFRAIELWFDAEPTLEVNIKGALLRLVAEASRYEDPELADLLVKLKAIQMRGFPLRRADFEDIERHAERLSRHLEDEGWDTVMHVRDHDERVDMYLRTYRGEIAGLLVMVVEPGENESVFVNIVGEIDPEQIGRLGRKFNLGRRFDDW